MLVLFLNTFSTLVIWNALFCKTEHSKNNYPQLKTNRLPRRAPHVSGGPTRSLYKTACRERDIQQGGVLGDGEGGGSGDENEGRGMKSYFSLTLVVSVLIGIILLLVEGK